METLYFDAYIRIITSVKLFRNIARRSNKEKDHVYFEVKYFELHKTVAFV